MDPVEIIETHDTSVPCNGGKGPLGHPLVYLSIKKEGYVDCPYCGRRFQLVSAKRASNE